MNLKKTFNNHKFAIAFFCGVASGHVLTGSETTFIERIEPDGTTKWVGGHHDARPLDIAVAVVGNELNKLLARLTP